MNLKSSELEKTHFEKYVIDMKRIIGVLGISATLLLTFSCDEQLFTEYDDQSFLRTTSLQSWEMMPDHNFTSEGTSVTDYMEYTLVSSTGGAQGGPEYRLEIKNLMSNGDFEDLTAVPDYDPWFVYDELGTAVVPVPGAAVIEVINVGVDEVIDNRTVKFIMDKDFRLAFKIGSTFIEPNTYISGKSYAYSMDYRTNSSLNMFFEPDWEEGGVDSGTLDSYSFTAFGGPNGVEQGGNSVNRNTYPPLDPTISSPKGANVFTAQNTLTMPIEDSLTFASSGSQTGYFDNFEVVRDVEENFDLRLRLKMDIDHRTDLHLIPGYYRFSIWVKQATLPSLNMYHSDRVELGIIGYDIENKANFEQYKVYYKTANLFSLYSQQEDAVFSGDWTSSWVQLIFETDETVQLPDITNTTVFELTVSPSNPGPTDSGWNRLSAGAISISDPKLEYSSTPWN